MNTKAFVSVGILFLLLLSPFRAAASPARDAIAGQAGENTVSVTFAQLGYSDSELVGPLDGTRKAFSLPANWTLEPGGVIVLDYDVIFSGTDVDILSGEANAYAGALTVSFNSRILGYIQLDSIGSKTASITIPAEAVQSVRENGQHELIVQLNAQVDCLYDVHTVVTVKATSRFDLLFNVTSPELNLAKLPAPFFLRNSLLPDRTLLVVSAESSAGELQAAINVMSGFGSLVERPFDLRLITDDQATEADLASANLIFVGIPGKIASLESIAFPLPIVGGQFSGLPGEYEGDGIIQMALSPWNPNKVVMLVSGNTGEAIVKAAQAAGSGKIFVHQNPALAYVRDVQELTGNLPIVQDFTLQDIGYDNEKISGIGVNDVSYLFYASKEQLASKDGLLSLVYYHSGLMDYGVSSISVELNGTAIISVPFSKETEQITTLEVKIPPGLLRFGENELAVQSRMQPELSCDFTGFSDPWLMVSNQTGLHLPIADVVPSAGAGRFDLKNFPVMFMGRSDLGDVTFVLPENDPLSWKIAADLAYALGANARPSISHLSVAFANDVPGETRAGDSLIVVGKASALPLVSEINDALPAPFDMQTNTAEERGMQIVYRIPAGVSVGYLEVAASPFAAGKSILMVSGNSDEGIVMAGFALLNDQLKDKLTGMFAITNGAQVDVSEDISQFSSVGSSIPGAQQVVTTPLAPGGRPASAFAQPAWLLPLLAVSAVVLLAIIVFATIGALRRGRSPSFETPADEEKDAEKN